MINPRSINVHLFLFIWLNIFISTSALATTYYVDATNGLDNNAGTSTTTSWKTIGKVNASQFSPGDQILFKRGEVWREPLTVPSSGAVNSPITFGAYGQGNKPKLLGSAAKNYPADWAQYADKKWAVASILDSDVGNLLFNDGAAVGRKVWNESDLTQQGDFWYDEENQTVRVISSVNPAVYYGNIECALKWENGALICINGKDNIVIQDLDIRYAGGHGIQATGAGNIVVRGCNLSFIGGSKLYGNVRYGNGVEFWNSNHDTTVEYCRLDQIYDAALTTQGTDANNQKVNQKFHYNIITNSEYAFEFWNRPSSSSTQNITFQNNTCAYAGMGWGHGQRPDPTGYHVVFYSNTAVTNGIFIRNNIFYEATRSTIFVDPVLNSLFLDYNVYYQSSGNTINFQGVQYDAASFHVYQTATQQDAHSVVHDPLFTGPTSGNFQLGTGSPCFGAGVNVGLTKDFNGVPVAADNVDIGALQRTLLRSPTSLRIVAAP